jgi:AraC-like DNA-binding protein
MPARKTATRISANHGKRRSRTPALVSFGDVRVGPLAPIPGLLAERGLDPAQVFAEAGVDPQLFADPENRIQVGALGKLLETCASRTNCAHFGILVGQRLDPKSLGDLHTLMRNCATLRDALHLGGAHLEVNDRLAVSLLLDLGDSRTALGYALFGGLTPGTVQVLDGAIAMQHRLLRELCGPSWVPLLVQLSRSRPANVRPFRHALGSNLEFDADLSAIVFDSRWLDHPIAGADARSYSAVAQAIESAASREPVSFAAQVRRAIYALLLTGSTSTPQVARLFDLSTRTLRRRLAAEDATVRGLTSDVRRELAYHLLRDTDLKLSEIATALRYADVSVFSRAFHAWSDVSPRRWRARHAP